MTTKLTIGRDRRLTKAGKIAEARFDALVVEHLKSIGAAPLAEGSLSWIVATIHGRLRVTPYGDWIAQSFQDWPNDYTACMKYARANGFEHWKWNFHYELTEEPNVDDWKRQLGRTLLPTGGA